VVNIVSDAISADSARDRRWLVLGVIGLAQLMVVLDVTVMNVAPQAVEAKRLVTRVTRSAPGQLAATCSASRLWSLTICCDIARFFLRQSAAAAAVCAAAWVG
jgi:hypothetical protein